MKSAVTRGKHTIASAPEDRVPGAAFDAETARVLDPDYRFVPRNRREARLLRKRGV